MYAQRDEAGTLVGVYSHPVEGIAEEPIAANTPELVAFLDRVSNPPQAE